MLSEEYCGRLGRGALKGWERLRKGLSKSVSGKRGGLRKAAEEGPCWCRKVIWKKAAARDGGQGKLRRKYLCY